MRVYNESEAVWAKVQRGFVAGALTLIPYFVFWLTFGVRTCVNLPDTMGPAFIVLGPMGNVLATIAILVAAFAIGYFVRFRFGVTLIVLAALVLIAVGFGFALATPQFCSPF